MHWFPRVPVIHYYKMGGLKQQKYILPTSFGDWKFAMKILQGCMLSDPSWDGTAFSRQCLVIVGVP